MVDSLNVELRLGARRFPQRPLGAAGLRHLGELLERSGAVGRSPARTAASISSTNPQFDTAISDGKAAASRPAAMASA